MFPSSYPDAQRALLHHRSTLSLSCNNSFSSSSFLPRLPPPALSFPPSSRRLLPLLFALRLIISTPSPPSPVLTVALCGGAGRQGNRVLHGSAQARVSAVGVAESGSVDVEWGVLGGEGRRRQGVGGVSEGRRLPQTPPTAGRLVQRDLLVLAEETGNEGLYFQNTTQRAGWMH